MAFIGNTVQTQGFTPAIDYFNGNGVTVTFTLSRPIASVAQVIVAIDNVIQNPSSSFTIAGNAITFSSAPLSGTNNIWVEYTSLITTYQAISQDPTVIGDIRATGGYLAEGDFGNSFVDGAILDYVTGLGRLTVGDADGLAIYNGGTAGRTALMTVAATGNVGVGTVSPGAKLSVTSTGNTTADGIRLTLGSEARPHNIYSELSTGRDLLIAPWRAITLKAGSGTTEGEVRLQSYESTIISTGSSYTERMRISSAGLVTTPFQTSFCARPPGGYTITNDVAIAGTWSADSNVGSAFNTSNGVFTAPVAGFYSFFWAVFLTCNSSRQDAMILVNGVIVARAEIGTYNTGSTNRSCSISLNYRLAANDTVTVAAFTTGSATIYVSSPPWNQFSGYLVG
jgi:hypothetical protein